MVCCLIRQKPEVIQYPVGKTDVEYTVPEGVTTIGDYSFFSCVNLNNIKAKRIKDYEKALLKNVRI